MAGSTFRLPEQLNISDGNIAENFRKWRRHVQIYLSATESEKKGKDIQVSIILHCAGPKVVEVYDQLKWDEPADSKDPEKVLKKLEDYCNPRSNEVIESHRFWCVQWQEPFDLFLTELRQRADRCNFGDQKDRLIRDKIIFTAQGKLQEHLLRQDSDSNTLEHTIKICRAFESSSVHIKEIRGTANFSNTMQASVHKLRASGKTRTGLSNPKRNDTRPPRSGAALKQKFTKDCNFCGGQHEMDKLKCPAWGKTCDKCKGRNHFKRKCKKVRVNSVMVDTDDNENDNTSDSDDKWLAAITTSSMKTVSAVMSVNGHDVKFQLDTAADVNTICQRHVRKDQVTTTNVNLKMWNKTNFKPLGEVCLDVTNNCTGEIFKVQFVVVPNDLICLLGLSAIQKMGFVTVNENMFVNAVSSSILGDLGEVHLEVDANVRPKALPSRKIPIAIQDRVKRELDVLVERGVLVPVTKPTVWVSQMAVAHKSNGDLRICLDPQPLNTALRREHYKLPTLDDILPKLTNAKIFSKLDVKEAYWHVRLDNESSELTTMITPFGRYRWARLPFGLNVSSEIFQRKLNEALGDLDGAFTLADDIIVAGCGKSESDARADNDTKLKALYKRCTERNIILNDAKKETGLREIKFHGHKITKDGIKADDSKIAAILNMPKPTDVTGVKRFCGLIQYLAKFLPDLANILEPMRELVRKDVQWNWTTKCDDAFETIKRKVTETPILAYFDSEREVVVQVDSSKDGSGAVLLQDGKPVEYASRTLKPSERKWAQIEKEALSILYGLERFDQYTYGRKVKVQNDHKPLESILKKPLSSAPKRLQDIMMKLHRYDFDFVFVPGKDLVIADTLSRAYQCKDDTDVYVRPRIMSVTSLADIPDARLQEIRKVTESDPDMQTLLTLIIDGWPLQRDQVPVCARPHFDYRDELSHEDGIITKSEAILIPKSLRLDMKKRLHSAHLGFDSMMRRARGTIFWPQMAKELQQLVDSCEACQELRPRNPKETLKQHDDGGSPWNKIGMDLFEIQGRTYLITVDYFTNFIEVDHLSTTTSTQVITTLKRHIARYGVPSIIVSDGGPQFTASQFVSFTKEWGITHVFSSPGHQQANGKAESAVKVIKYMMIKANKTGTDQTAALLELRNTPQQGTGLSPTELMFGRKTQTLIPTLRKPQQNVNKRKETVKRCYDKRAHNLKMLDVGQSVYFEHKQGERWKLGKIDSVMGDRTYLVQSSDGGLYSRNRVHIRPTKVKVFVQDPILPLQITQAKLPYPTSPVRPTIPDKPHVADTPCDFNACPNKLSSSGAPEARENSKIASSDFEAMRSRPSRQIKEPSYLKDFIRY